MSTKPVFTKGASTSAGPQGPGKRPPVLRWDSGVSFNLVVRARHEADPPAAAPGVVEGSIEDVWWVSLDDMINIVMVSFTEALVLPLTIVLNRKTQKLSAGPRALASV
jgi:hypothetical protein